MSEVLLSIAPTPMTSFQYMAYVLAVLLNYSECQAWFHSHYIQLEYYQDKKGESLCFVGSWITDVPWIDYQYIEKADFVTYFADQYQILKSFISDGWYVYSHFDEFYIPGRVKFNKVHFRYDFLLYGYNDERQEYSILGYGNKGMFETTQISYQDFAKAFESNMESTETTFPNPPCILLFKKRKDFVFNFSMKYFYDMLSDYVYSRDTAARLGILQRKELKERTFGLNTYDELAKYFQLIGGRQVANYNRSLYQSARSLHVLWEHKKCMLLRLAYLKQQGFIVNIDPFLGFYQKLENELLVLRNTQLSYSLKEDPEILKKIVKSLLEIKRQETEVLEGLLEMIQRRLV